MNDKPETVADVLARKYSDDDLNVILQDWDHTDPDQAVTMALAAEVLQLRRIERALSAQPADPAKASGSVPDVRAEWSLHDRVEFALRDAGFDYDLAFDIASKAATPSASTPQPEPKPAAADLVIRTLVAGGFVDAAKVEQARKIVAELVRRRRGGGDGFPVRCGLPSSDDGESHPRREVRGTKVRNRAPSPAGGQEP